MTGTKAAVAAGVLGLNMLAGACVVVALFAFGTSASREDRLAALIFITLAVIIGALGRYL